MYVVFLFITDNEFYDTDCVLSIEGPTAASNKTYRLGPLPPLPSEVSSNKQTLNMVSLFVGVSEGVVGIRVSCIDFTIYPEISFNNAFLTALEQLL